MKYSETGHSPIQNVDFSLVSFSKMKLLQFKQGLYKRVFYKTLFADTTPSVALIAPEASPRRSLPNVSAVNVAERLLTHVPCSTVVELSSAKIKDVESLYHLMSRVDVACVKSLARRCNRAEVPSTSAAITACPEAASASEGLLNLLKILIFCYILL